MLLGLAGMLLAACGGAINTPAATPTAARSSGAMSPAELSTSIAATSAAEATMTGDATAPPITPDIEERPASRFDYEFQPVAGWEVERQQNVAGMSPPDASAETGPAIALTVGNLENLYVENVSSSDIATSRDLYDALIAGIELETMNLELDTPEEITVDGHTAFRVGFRSTGFGNIESDVAGQLAVGLIDEQHSFVMLGMASPPDAWRYDAEFANVLASLRFVEAQPTATPQGTPTLTPTGAPSAAE
jgi:hypothetical protein